MTDLSFTSGDNYDNATALIIIFRLNNYKSNKTFINMAMVWEKKFLDFVEHYESDNLTLHYLAEVCFTVAFLKVDCYLTQWHSLNLK